jgi:molecular chaperone GrpE (heat shock protein)
MTTQELLRQLGESSLTHDAVEEVKKYVRVWEGYGADYVLELQKKIREQSARIIELKEQLAAACAELKTRDHDDADECVALARRVRRELNSTLDLAAQGRTSQMLSCIQAIAEAMHNIAEGEEEKTVL